MSRPSSWLYLWILVAAVAAALAATPVVGRMAVRWGIVDKPDARRPHLVPVSLLGGLAIYSAAFAGAWGIVPSARQDLQGFFIGGLVLLVFGLQDDITPLNPTVKLMAQVASGLVLIGSGTMVQLTGNDFIDGVLTVGWIIAVVNAVNYQDNANGLAAGLVAVSSIGFFVIAVTEQQYLIAILSVALTGSCIGFLPSNYPKARVFMGDAGSMFIGYLLAFLGIRLRFLDKPRSTTFLIPLLLLGLPLFDLMLVTASRLRRGLSPATAGTDHSSHRLIRFGLPSWAAVASLWSTQAVLCGVAVMVARLGNVVDVVSLAAVALLALFAGYALERTTITAKLPRREAGTSTASHHG